MIWILQFLGIGGTVWSSLKFAWKNRRFLWALKDLPALIRAAEKVIGPGHGKKKKAHIIDFLYDALVLAEKGTGKEFVDEERARKAASWLIDGTVEMFNAFGLWGDLETAFVSEEEKRRLLGCIGIGLFMAWLATPGMAQNYAVWLGASFDADPAQAAPAGHVCGLLGPAGSSNFSITCLSARGSADNTPLYDISQGFARLIRTQGRFSLYGLAQGGISTSDSATTGLFSGGLAVSYRITDKYKAIGGIQGAHSPSLEGWKPRVLIGFKFEP